MLTISSSRWASRPRLPTLARRVAALAALSALACFAPSCSNDRDERLRETARLGASPGAESIGRLRTMLRDPDPDVRALALVALAGADATEGAGAALASIDDVERALREAAVRVLGVTCPEPSLEALTARLRSDPSGVVRARAADALAGCHGERAAEALSGALLDLDPAVRQAAARGLAKAREDIHVARLAKVVLLDFDWSTRVEAVRALAAIGTPAARVAIDPALADPNEFVRLEARLALREALRSAAGAPW